MKSRLEILETNDNTGKPVFCVPDLLLSADPEGIVNRATSLVWMMAANQASAGSETQIKALIPKLKGANLPAPLIGYMSSLVGK